MAEKTDQELHAEWFTVLDKLWELEQAPHSLPAWEEFFFDYRLLEERLFDIGAELIARHPEQRLAAIP